MKTQRLRPHISAHHFFGAELRHWREQRGMSQAELAAAVHVSPDLIRKVERAERWPTATLAVACDDHLQSHGILARLQQLVESERVCARRAQPTLDHETIAHIVYRVLEVTDPIGVGDGGLTETTTWVRMREGADGAGRVSPFRMAG